MSRDEFTVDRLIPRLEAVGLLEHEHQNDAAGYATWRKRQLKRIERIINGDAPFPLAWSVHWIACLPDEYQRQCRHQLCALHGSYFLPLPVGPRSHRQPTRAALDELSKEFSDVLAKSKPAMDGMYDDTDDPQELQYLMDEIHELVAAGLAEMARIQRATGAKSTLQRIFEHSPFNDEAP